MKITGSARKHQITDEDMLHAVRQSIVRWPLDEDVTMCVGPARDGAVLEVAVVTIDDEELATIIHAMPCRAKFLPPRR